MVGGTILDFHLLLVIIKDILSNTSFINSTFNGLHVLKNTFDTTCDEGELIIQLHDPNN